MVPDIANRLFWAVAIIGLGLIAYWLVNRLVLARAAVKARSGNLIHPGYPVLLYFTTQDCVPCKTVQHPAIESLKSQLGAELEVVEVDAAIHPELASEWGVMSVPTIFIIDASGRPRHVNHGVTTADKLFNQLKGIVQ
jgi:thiol-disulfide isomerase/thioredoxin